MKKKEMSKHELLTLLVALIALILTQLPPLYQMLQSANLVVREENTFSIYTSALTGFFIGREYTVDNKGEKQGNVKDIGLYILNKDGDILDELMAEEFKNPGITELLPQMETFNGLSVKPGDPWSRFVTFKKNKDIQDFEEIIDIKIEIKDERDAWEYEMENNDIDINSLYSPMFEMSEELLGKLKLIVMKKIEWLKEGEFYLVEVTFTDDKPIVKQYYFDIKQNHLISIIEAIDDSTVERIGVMFPNIIIPLKSVNIINLVNVNERIKQYNKKFTY